MSYLKLLNWKRPIAAAMDRRIAAVLMIAAFALLGFACTGGGTGPGGQSAVIKVDGSSTVFPITEAVAEEFQKEKPGVKVTVGISGTGGGFKKFVRGEIDVADASRPILAEEMAQAKTNGIEFIELPVAFDALTVVVNNQNNWVTSMTVDELKKIWEPGCTGKDHSLEPGAARMAQRKDRALRRGRRLRDFRLLHRSDCRESQIESRGLHR